MAKCCTSEDLLGFRMFTICKQKTLFKMCSDDLCCCTFGALPVSNFRSIQCFCTIKHSPLQESVWIKPSLSGNRILSVVRESFGNDPQLDFNSKQVLCARTGAPDRLLASPPSMFCGHSRMKVNFQYLMRVDCQLTPPARRKDWAPRSKFPREFKAKFTMKDGQVHVLELCYLQSGQNRDAWAIKDGKRVCELGS